MGRKTFITKPEFKILGPVAWVLPRKVKKQFKLPGDDTVSVNRTVDN